MKTRLIAAFFVVLLLASAAVAADVGPELQACSVNIKADSSQGSGTVVLRKVDEQQVAFILTAAHVVRHLRSVKTVIIAGDEKKRVTYEDAQIVQEVPTADQTRIVGDRRLDAKILCVDSARDIALLRVRAVGELHHGIKFYRGSRVPTVGTSLLHCGSPGGQDTGGTATVTGGIVSRTGVRIAEHGGSEHGIYDQTDVSSMPGSSGGMLCLARNGEWVGMITLGLRSGDSFAWYVPIRNVQQWAAEVGCEWLLDEKGETSEEALGNMPLENSAGGGGGASEAKVQRVWREKE